jgi:hypothetical protein
MQRHRPSKQKILGLGSGYTSRLSKGQVDISGISVLEDSRYPGRRGCNQIRTPLSLRRAASPALRLQDQQRGGEHLAPSPHRSFDQGMAAHAHRPWAALGIPFVAATSSRFSTGSIPTTHKSGWLSRTCWIPLPVPQPTSRTLLIENCPSREDIYRRPILCSGSWRWYSSYAAAVCS